MADTTNPQLISTLPAAELRRHKGISFTGIATTFQCHDQSGRILLSQRSARARDERGTWESGAGGLKWGTTLENNVRREVVEEYGAQPISIEFWGYRDVFRTNHDGQPTHWLGMDFGVLVDASAVRNNAPDAIDQIGWFTFDNLPSPLHSQMERTFKLYPDRYRRIFESS